MSPSNARYPEKHIAQAPEGAREWNKPRCVECDRPLVWVVGSGRKAPRWQHAEVRR